MNNLQLRFLEFSKNVVSFCKRISQDTVSRPLVSQLVRSATSIGANYSEAQSGISRKDFRAKVYICLKEANETKYWLEIFLSCFPEKQSEINLLLDEAKQITKMLQSIANKLA